MYSLVTLNKLLERKQNTHKGQSGHVLVIGGSENLAGAPILASVAALRVGADLVTLAAPKEACIAAQSYCPDIIVKKLPGDYLKSSHYALIIKDIERYDVLLIGNGIGLNADTKRLISKLLKNKDVKQKLKVIDADALKMIRLENLDNTILTPHKKEYEILMSNSENNLNNNVIILKGKVDRIITKNTTYLNKTGNPDMAKAGTGDVLAGLSAGILANTRNLEESAKAAAWLSGYLGDVLKKRKKGYYYIASDLIEEIQNII